MTKGILEVARTKNVKNQKIMKKILGILEDDDSIGEDMVEHSIGKNIK